MVLPLEAGLLSLLSWGKAGTPKTWYLAERKQLVVEKGEQDRV